MKCMRICQIRTNMEEKHFLLSIHQRFTSLDTSTCWHLFDIDPRCQNKVTMSPNFGSAGLMTMSICRENKDKDKNARQLTKFVQPSDELSKPCNTTASCSDCTYEWTSNHGYVITYLAFVYYKILPNIIRPA